MMLICTAVVICVHGDWAADEARVSHTAPGCPSLRRTTSPTSPLLSHPLPLTPTISSRPPPAGRHLALAVSPWEWQRTSSPAACARASASGLRTARLAVRAAALPADGRGGDGAASYKKLGTSATRSFMRIPGRLRKKSLKFVMPSVQCGVNWTN